VSKNESESVHLLQVVSLSRCSSDFSTVNYFLAIGAPRQGVKFLIRSRATGFKCLGLNAELLRSTGC
jgi:hypothetical protein